VLRSATKDDKKMGPVSSFARAAPRAGWEADRDVLFCPRADEAYFVLDAQICAVEILSRDIVSAPDKAFVDRCVADIESVRDALYELHFGTFDAQKSRRPDCEGFPLGAYLVAGHLWCRAMLEELRRHVSQARASTSTAEGALATRPSDYVRDHAEPLFRELVLFHEAASETDHAVRPILERAERVHAEIIRTNWTPAR
jgi:hypothetical protein